MKKCFTEPQIAFALRQAASGPPVVEIMRKMGISEATFYRWKKQSAEMGVSFPETISHLSPVRRAILSIEKAIWRGFSFAEMASVLGILVGIGVVAFSEGLFSFRRMAA